MAQVAASRRDRVHRRDAATRRRARLRARPGVRRRMIWEVDEQKPTIEGLDAQGRADPAYAAALGLLRAPFGRRALAADDRCDDLVDPAAALLDRRDTASAASSPTGAISPYGFLNHPDFLLAVVMASISTLLGLVYLVVQLVLHGRKGVTIGKAVDRHPQRQRAHARTSAGRRRAAAVPDRRRRGSRAGAGSGVHPHLADVRPGGPRTRTARQGDRDLARRHAEGAESVRRRSGCASRARS